MMIGNRRSELKYQSLIFIVMLVCSCALIRDAQYIVDEIYALALPDYSMGYSSRMLVGSALKLFKDTFTREWLRAFYICVDGVAVLASMLFLRGFVSSADKEQRMPRLVLAMFFASFPYAVPHFAGFLGYLDVYWYILSIIAILLIDVKVLRWFIPALTVVCVVVHPAYALAFFPPVVILLLYRAFTGDSKGKGKGAFAAILTIAFLLTAAASVYSVFFEKNFLKMTVEQASEYMNSKLNVGSAGVEFYFFGDMAVRPDGFENVPVANNIFSTIKTIRLLITESRTLGGVLKTAAKFLPFFVAVDYIWIKALRSADNKKEKFVYFLCVLCQLQMPFTWFASTDMTRWGANCLIAELIMLIWMINKKNKNVTKAFMSLCTAAKNHPLVLSTAVMLSYLIL